ncbi:FAD:protein FMN transferase [Floccifex sp.]|uniref:FAD:protein FMN transferase n=1 Tax=Floccifex sp. TaxID=2815810 RepID=UPI002A747D69|nr:FAD:protein FMN transferase [Floccifex sp.]MDD7281135.1 FAD:protein FMN transferase [Erysipelotrichaceae bacterium]MDY2958065.1 FAD:protein FMN transferase [Floccifex sp.]
MKKSIKYWLVLSICFLVLICSLVFYINNDKPKVTSQSITLTDAGFDTAITLSCTSSDSDFDKYVDIVKSEYTYYNSLFDQYNAYDINNVYTINNEGYEHPVKVDKELIECIEIAQEVYQLSPEFDITSGDLLSIWHEYRMEGMELNDQGKDGSIPSETELQEALKHKGFDKIKVTKDSVQLLDPDVSLDLGGIAKGFATQKVKEKLNEQGLTNGFINAGGNVVLLGEKEDGWRIGIQKPDTNESLLTYYTEKPISIVTSGDYQRYYQANNQRYSHIIDPSTGYPATRYHSVSVIMDDSRYADALSTLFFCIEKDEAIDIINELNMDIDVIWIEDKSDKECDYQTDEYNISCTDPDSITIKD